MAPPQKLRARRARAHWRGRGHDLRSHYRQGDLPPAPDLAVVEFDDPYAPSGWVNPDGTLDPNARLRQARRPDGSIAEGQPEWVAPPRSRVSAVARLKEDPLGRMHARHQLGEAQYLSGREYQLLHDSTQVGLVRSVDLSKTKVSGGRHFDPLTDRRRNASRKLRFADEAIHDRHGTEGLALVRDVLCERRTVEQSARLRGTDSERDSRWFGILLRKCLAVLAVEFGFASSTRRPSRPARLNDDSGIPDTADASMHAGDAELGNVQLRYGRPNGRG
jgi:hypothetical protein